MQDPSLFCPMCSDHTSSGDSDSASQGIAYPCRSSALFSPNTWNCRHQRGQLPGLMDQGCLQHHSTETPVLSVCHCRAGDLRDRSTQRDSVCSCMQSHHHPCSLLGSLFTSFLWDMEGTDSWVSHMGPEAG